MLSAIVVVAVIKLIDPAALIFLWNTSKSDTLVYMVVFLCTLFLGVQPALIIGVIGNWVLFLVSPCRVQLILFVICS